MPSLTRPRRAVPGRVALVLGVVLALSTTACVGAKKGDSNASRNAGAKSVTLRVSANAVLGGKNAAGAAWMTNYVIPNFTKMEKAKGVDVKVTFEGSGVDDAQYKTKLELGLRTNSAPDVFSMDGIWLGEMAAAGYAKPLTETVGKQTDDWDGWQQIPESVQGNLSYQGKRYGIPDGTDGRVIFYNKKLFAQAGLPADWQPKTWAEIISAGQALKKVSGVTPIQLDAGVPMGEATTAQGFLPLLYGTGAKLYDENSKKWQGNTAAVKDVLGFYQQIYGGGLGDVNLQKDQAGRDRSFAEFSKSRIGMLFEGDYLWRSVVCPDKDICGATAMSDRKSTVGFALIPSKSNGKFVSGSGGGGWMIKPGTKYPQQAWELMQYINSHDAILAEAKTSIRVTSRNDVNSTLLADDPCLTFISKQVLPVTTYRPSDQHYNQVSSAIQQATADIVSGKSPEQAASAYATALAKVVGEGNVSSG